MNQSAPEKVALVTGGGKRRVGNVIAQALAGAGSPSLCTTTARPQRPGSRLPACAQQASARRRFRPTSPTRRPSPRCIKR